ncbi:MAG TPA: tetratricopeptide repeat protein, partial [Gemmatimonadales bacterium]
LRPLSTPLDATLAQEIAQREGASAVVAGEIAPLASGYVLSVRLLGADGSTLLAEREIANDVGGIIPAVERLSKSLREDIGESLRSLRAEEPLQQVSTSSLEALRLYSQAEQVNNAGRGLEAVRLLEQAVAQDSTFAMAWRKLAVVLGNWGFDPARRAGAAQRAYELRDRLPRREGALATAYWFHFQGRRSEAIAAYRQLLATWPDDYASRNNLGLLFNQEGHYAEAESLLQTAIDSGSTLMANFDNLIDAQLLARNYPGAERTVTTFAARLPRLTEIRQGFSSRIAQVRGDYQHALALMDSMVGSSDPARRSWAWSTSATLLRLQGRLREALNADREWLLASQQVGRESHMGSAITQEVIQAMIEAQLLGRLEAARRRLVTALKEHPLDSLPPAGRPYALVVVAFLQARAGDQARELLQQYQRAGQAGGEESSGDLDWAEGMMALSDGRHAEAIERLRSAARRWGCRMCAQVPIGQAFDRLGQADSALAAYEEYASRQMYWNMGQEVDLAPTYVRLGELYEARGDRARALEYYGKFIDMWKNADAELQPRVAEIRRRVGELAREPAR